MRESSTTTGSLARLGFTRTDRVRRFLAEPVLSGLGEGAARAIGATPDGDDAVLGLVRVAEAARAAGRAAQLEALLGRVGEESGPGHRLIRVLGTSVALGDFLARHPDQLDALDEEEDAFAVGAEEVRAQLLRAVGADPAAQVPVATQPGRESRDALRVAYHRRLLRIAAADVTASEPEQIQPAVSAALSDLADAALDAAVATARAAVADHELVAWSVIAMGKTGARELNYISDVDVMHVIGPAAARGGADAESGEPGAASGGADGAGASEDDLVRIGSRLARELARVCADRTAEGALWQVDANLRPEGKDGPLVRTLDSYARYYRTWAHSWEFQALLKARAAAGDRALGESFEQMVRPWIWQASAREGFVEDTRAMRRRVIAHIPRGEADRNVKLGPGGLRDVEFTVQLLQMVHGRTDEGIHLRSTLDALGALGKGGYISRAHVGELDEAYRFLRTVEHRLQLHRMRRTQVLPTAEEDLRRLSRSLGMKRGPFQECYEATRRRVRQLHEEIFYRPLLVTASNLSEGEVRLTPQDARARLAAIGYRDPARALTHIEALTDGISRRASIQRQLLPALLEWFADGIDPDLGLLAFRRLSDEIGSAHWYLALLRDSGRAAQRLTRVLAGSRFIGSQLEQIPEAVRWLADDATLAPVPRTALLEELRAVILRAGDAAEACEVLRRTRRRELLRIAMGQLAGAADPELTARALTDLAEAVVEAGLLISLRETVRERGGEPAGAQEAQQALGVEVAVLALGSFGACEMGYSSDADVQFVMRERGAGAEAAEIAVQLASRMQQQLNATDAGPSMRINADLRPEGRSGVLVRSLDSWREYYRRDALTWEKQALLRARAIVGPEDLRAEIEDELDRHRFPAGGLDAAARRDVRRMKARMESERLPRGADPARQVKLGRGGMTDVEWCAQVLAMDHGEEAPALRSTRTLEVLRAAVEAELLPGREERELEEAWLLAWQIRRALFLWKGREGAVLPTDRIDLRAVARIIDGEDGTAADLEERYLRLTRRARTITESVVFGEPRDA